MKVEVTVKQDNKLNLLLLLARFSFHTKTTTTIVYYGHFQHHLLMLTPTLAIDCCWCTVHCEVQLFLSNIQHFF